LKIKKITILSILALSLITGCGEKEKTEEIADAVVAKPKKQQLPIFNLKTSTGKDIVIKVKKDGWEFVGYEGKVVLLNFFGTWCPPCKAEIPHLVALNEKYKDKFAVIAVVVEQNKPNEQMKQFIAEHHINYPITNSDVNFELANAVGGVSSIPAMFLFDKSGKVVQHYVGAVPIEMLESDIKKAFGN
jgi:thiol-disulfide isomerase/thioredoxin